MKNGFLLDVPPGIGLLGMAAEYEGYCVVNGPDLLWGRDMCGWHPIKSVFEGVIGGPPCQLFSRGNNRPRKTPQHPNLVPEFIRIVQEADPDWFLMENVVGVPNVVIEGYTVSHYKYNLRWLGEEQNRERYIQFGSKNGATLLLPEALFENPNWESCCVASEGKKGHRPNGFRPGYFPRRPWPRFCELQGLPPDFDLPSFTIGAKYEAVGSGVPIKMGRAIFKAIRRART